MTTPDVTVLGELNIDLLLNRLDQLPEVGKEILAQEMAVSLGSSSAIFAANLSALGTSVQFMGKLGDDLFGSYILRILNERNVQTDTIIQDRNVRTGVTVILNRIQDRAMITHPGAMANFASSEIDWDAVQKTRHLHLSSVFLQPLIHKDVVQIFRQAKQMGLSTSLDPQSDPAEKWELPLAELLPYVDVFLPNETELCKLTGTNELSEAIARVSALCSVLVVKMGTRGSICLHGDIERRVSAKRAANFQDAIGAGDSYNAGFIYQWLKGETIDKCQDFGNLCGSFSTTRAGGITAFNTIQNLYAYEPAIA